MNTTQGITTNERKVLMTEREADVILQRMFHIGYLYDISNVKDSEWSYLYDLVEEGFIVAFATDSGHRVDVVQLDSGNGYAFNFWERNCFFGQIVMDNTWKVVDIIRG